MEKVAIRNGTFYTKMCRWGLGIATRAQLVKKSAWLLHLIGDSASSGARDSSEIAQSTPNGTHYHAEAIYLLREKKGARSLWYSEVGLHQLGSRPSFFASSV